MGGGRMNAEEAFEAMERGPVPPAPAMPDASATTSDSQEKVETNLPEDTEADISKEVERLASLQPLEYDQQRKGAAKRLGVQVATLDKAVKSSRNPDKPPPGKGFEFPSVEPWPDPVDGAALLSEIRDVVRRFIVCEEETKIVVALWCAFTWYIEAVQVAPLAIITAPEMQCGKSQLLDLMARLSRRPLPSSNITSAALFRVIEQGSPTLFIDEADSFMKQNEDLRGIINSGHTRSSAYVLRTVGEDFEPKAFSTWGAKAIAGIGKLSGTIMDRGIILELRRKLPTERVERLRHVDANLFPCLASKLSRWSENHMEVIRAARPSDVPDALSDRAQDSWEPLLAIADCAGGEWPALARGAAVKLSERNAENTVSTGAELLSDIRDVFEQKSVDRISSKDLLEALTSDEEKSWHTYNRGAPMTPRQLAKRLGEYGIAPGTIRTWAGTPKGYRHQQFADAFARYLDHQAKEPEVVP
jgi:putative DNA primase/helicase